MAQPGPLGGGPPRPPGGLLGGAGGRAGPAGDRARDQGVDRRRHRHPPGRGELVGFDVVLLGCVRRARGRGRPGAGGPRSWPRPARRHRPARVPGGPGARTSPARRSRSTSRPWWPGSSTSWPRGRPGPAGRPGRPAGGSRRPRAGCAAPWTPSATSRPGRCGRSRCGSCRASCGRRPPGDVWFKASRDLPLFVNEAVLTGSWPGCSPATCPPPWPSTPSAAGWRWPTSGPRLGWDAPAEDREDVLPPSPGSRSRRPPRSTGCSRQDAWTAGCPGWPPRRSAGCRRSPRQAGSPGSTPRPGCRPARRPSWPPPGPGWRRCAPSSRPPPSRPPCSTATCTCRTWPRAPTGTCSSTGPTPVSPTRSST